MKQNMGSLDRVLRLSVALVIAVLYFTDQMSGTAAVVLGLFALIFAMTSFVGFCPLYVPLKFSTRKSKKQQHNLSHEPRIVEIGMKPSRSPRMSAG
ncbi:MAG: DUF2892 domain-containing protein [Bacteroidota bacterium]|jgi:hypothetical protein